MGRKQPAAKSLLSRMKAIANRRLGELDEERVRIREQQLIEPAAARAFTPNHGAFSTQSIDWDLDDGLVRLSVTRFQRASSQQPLPSFPPLWFEVTSGLLSKCLLCGLSHTAVLGDSFSTSSQPSYVRVNPNSRY